MNRRLFLQQVVCVGAVPAVVARQAAAAAAARPEADPALAQRIAEQRPSRQTRLPADFNSRVGATHVAGKYHLTAKPFLVEGAEKLIELGTRVGKFWFESDNPARSYPFNSRWGRYRSLTELAQADDFQRAFALPFTTIILEANSAAENGWKRPQPESFYQAVTQEYHDVTAHFYRQYRDRAVTFVLQHWEGDWLLRGAGKSWNPPPANWAEPCGQMRQWLAARQAGVTRARAEFGAGARCRVAHAAEVNRVADIWKGLPTMTDRVLPGLELDLVSYSSYDALKDGVTLYQCLQEIRKHARTGPLFGPGAVYVGEIGIPENEQPARLVERWDEFLGAALAANALYVVHWELYCNELNPKIQPAPKPPITDPSQVRGFWLVKPDGSLSLSGNYLRDLWRKGASAG